MNCQILLNWVGGAGGDILINLLSTQNNLYMNVNPSYKLDSNSGQSIVTSRFDKEHPSLCELARAIPLINQTFLIRDLINLKKKHKSFVLKSHLFNKDIEKELKKIVEVVHIGFDIEFLPYIIQSAFLKNKETLENSKDPKKTHFDKTLIQISSKLTEKQNKDLVLWNLIQDTKIKIEKFDLQNAKIHTIDLFNNNSFLTNFFADRDTRLDFRSDYVTKWKEKNSILFPSKTYLKYIKHKNYNYQDSTLNDIERYILLSLSGNKFKFLK